MSQGEGNAGFEGWAILELMGHRRLGGRVREATVAGAAFIRIDVPHPNDSTLFRATHFYSPGAIHSITPTTAEIASAIARGAPDPVIRLAPPRLATSLPSGPESAWEEPGAMGDADDVDGGEPYHACRQEGTRSWHRNTARPAPATSITRRLIRRRGTPPC